jgi:hypothetical protein
LVIHVLVHLRGRHVVIQMAHNPNRADYYKQDERERRNENGRLPAFAVSAEVEMEEEEKLHDELDDGEHEDRGNE